MPISTTLILLKKNSKKVGLIVEGCKCEFGVWLSDRDLSVGGGGRKKTEMERGSERERGEATGQTSDQTTRGLVETIRLPSADQINNKNIHWPTEEIWLYEKVDDPWRSFGADIPLDMHQQVALVTQYYSSKNLADIFIDYRQPTYVM